MKRFLFFSFSICLSAFNAFADTLFKSETFFLNNGMEVVVLENHRAPVVTHMVWYKTGASNDALTKGGTAHLLEHLMFKGTKKVKDGAFSKIIARNGGEENAFTGLDFTAYFQNIARDKLELVMFLESDRMRGLTLSQEDFSPERQVVAEERLMRYDNVPNAAFAERKKNLLWGKHAYARPVIGTKEEIAKLELDDVLGFYKKYYAPDNAVLVVAGDITAAELKPLAEKYYGVVPPSRQPVQKKVFPEPAKGKLRLEMTHPLAKTKTLAKDFIVPSVQDENQTLFYAFEVLADILGAPQTGVLYDRLVVRQKTASAAGASYNGYVADKGTFSLYAVASQKSDMEKIEKEIERIPDLLKKSLNEKMIQKAKKRLTAGMEYVNDSPETLANIMGMVRVLNLNPDVILKYRENINAITFNDVQNALNLLETAPQITGILLPEKPL